MPIQITSEPYIGPLINRGNSSEIFKYVRLNKGLSFQNGDSKVDCTVIEIANKTVKLQLDYSSALSRVNIGRKPDSTKRAQTHEILEENDDLGKVVINVALNAYFEMPGLGVFRLEKKGKELIVFNINPDKGTNVRAIGVIAASNVSGNINRNRRNPT